MHTQKNDENGDNICDLHSSNPMWAKYIRGP